MPMSCCRFHITGKIEQKFHGGSCGEIMLPGIESIRQAFQIDRFRRGKVPAILLRETKFLTKGSK